jgi:hypothetical protein
MLANITVANITSDINGLINGTITSVSGLSSGADKTNSTITGSYPTGTYSLVGAGTNTFSKVHATAGSYTHYFRLNYNSLGLANVQLAQSYTSGTDTLVNSSTINNIITPFNYTAYNGGITLVIASQCLHITSAYNGRSFGIFDLGANGITSSFANNMRMAYIDTASGAATIPYGYNYAGATSAYTTLTCSVLTTTQPIMTSNIALANILPENPCFVASSSQAYLAYGVANLLRIPPTALDRQYNTSGVARQTGAGYAVVDQ